MNFCDDCKYFFDNNETSGFCYRYPPKVFCVGNEDESQAVYFRPLVDKCDFCGEWVEYQKEEETNPN
jgi:hypothetical protein